MRNKRRSKEMGNLLWYLKQLFPLTYRTTYGDAKGRHFVVWRMWLGRCFDEQDVLIADPVSPAEAVYGLMGWLSSRDEPVTLSSKHSSAAAAELAAEWCEVNALGEPRKGPYPMNLRHPEGVAGRAMPELRRPADSAEYLAGGAVLDSP